MNNLLEKLKSAEGPYKDLFLNTTDAVYVVDTNRKIVFWSKKAEEITGYKKEEMEGLQCFCTKLKHESLDGDELCTAFCPLVATIYDLKPRHSKVTFMHKDGHRELIMVNTYPIFLDDNVIGAFELFYKVD